MITDNTQDLINEKNKVISYVVKNLQDVKEQKPDHDKITDPIKPDIVNHDPEYVPPTIINNIPIEQDSTPSNVPDDTEHPDLDIEQDPIVSEDSENTEQPETNIDDPIVPDVPEHIEQPESNNEQQEQDNLTNNNLLFI